MNRRWIGLILIIIIYGFVFQQFEGLSYFQNKTIQYRHIINYGFLIAVAITGYWAFANYKYNWVKKIWILLYSLVIIIVTVSGVLDLTFKLNLRVRDFLHDLLFFFTSPLPFAFLLFLSRRNIQIKLPNKNKTG